MAPKYLYIGQRMWDEKRNGLGKLLQSPLGKGAKDSGMMNLQDVGPLEGAAR